MNDMTPSEQRLKALIVDDDQFLLTLYRKKGEESGIDLKAAAGGQEAIDIVASGFEPDIIALDMSMAGMSGIDVIKELRTKQLAERAKIIILSNTAEDELVNQAKALGVEHFIVKASLLPSQVMEELMKIARS